MEELSRSWTSVGSAGTLNHSDLAKVTMSQSIVQLGMELTPNVITQNMFAQFASALESLGPAIPSNQAVVRYNITATDGLFAEHSFRYHLHIRYRGRVVAALIEVDLETGAEVERIHFDSSQFPSAPGFQVQSAYEGADSVVMDFVNKAYYVQATLTAPAIAVGHPAAIAMVKVSASLNFPG